MVTKYRDAGPPASLPSGESPPLPDLLTLLWEAHHAMLAMSRHMERHVGLTGPQRLVLREVDRQPGISPGELAAALGVHASTITGLVERLVGRGLLTRGARAEDRRSFSLHATAQGRALLGAPGRTIEAVVDTASADIPASELQATARVLQTMACALRAAAGDVGVGGR